MEKNAGFIRLIIRKRVFPMQKKFIPIMLAAALLLSGLLSLISIFSQQGNARVINYTGVVRGATQLLVKEELHGQPNDALMEHIDQIIDELMTGQGGNHLSRLPDEDFQAAMGSLKDSWLEIKDEILKVRQGGEKETLFLLSEDFFKQANLTVSAAELYTEKQVAGTMKGFLVLFVLVACVSVLAAVSTIRQRRRLKAIEEVEQLNQHKKEQLEKMSEALRAPLNDLTELMYITDLETYDLLFLNETGLRNFGLDSYEGRKCYEVLRGRDTPCEFCGRHYSPDGETYTWEDTNPVTGRHYILKDRNISWEGRPARLEIAFDITEAEAEKQNLKYTLKAQDMIMECVRTLYQGRNLGDTIPRILEHLGRFLEAERTYIFLMHPDGLLYNDYEWCSETAIPQADKLQALPLSFFDSWMPRFNRQECILITDLEQLKESSPEEYTILKDQDIRSLAAAPLERDGMFCGCIGVDNPPRERLIYISSLLQTLCYFLLLAMRRAEDEKQLSHLSYHDTLTSFYNRNRYIRDSESLQDSNIPVGIVYLDVNGLKDLNDKRGHAFGDKILKEAAERMKEVFGQADYYRIGGDEFVIICRSIDEQTFHGKVRELKDRFHMDSLCRAAIGSQWSPRLHDINEITSEADALMYEDKKEFYRKNPASNRYRHQSDELLELSNPNILEAEITKNRFVVYMQPKVSSADRTAIGAEALIRYHSEEGSMVLPGNFLPLLEETQTISQIDFFVFEFVCSRIKKWVDMGKQTFPVSINFSQHSLAQPSFVEQLCTICRKYDIPSRLLEVEITENVRETQDFNLHALISKLRQAGFIVALADFSTDYANINLLTTAEFDVLKLDKTMLEDIARNPKTRAFIESIVETCRNMGIRLVAEGIETEEQMAELRKCGVELVQGFLFSKPISMEEYEEKYLSHQS